MESRDNNILSRPQGNIEPDKPCKKTRKTISKLHNNTKPDKIDFAIWNNNLSSDEENEIVNNIRDFFKILIEEASKQDGISYELKRANKRSKQ